LASLPLDWREFNLYDQEDGVPGVSVVLILHKDC